VNQIDNAAFGYSLKNKALMNRDRTVVDRQALRDAVVGAWARCTDAGAILALLKALANDRTQYEGAITCYSTQVDWTVMARTMYGEKVCLRSSDDQANQRAKYLGYEVVDFGDGMNSTMQYSGVGLKRAEQVAPLKHKEVSRRDLNTEQERVFRTAKNRVRLFLGLHAGDEWHTMLKKARIAELPDCEAKIEPTNGQVWVNKDTLTFGNENRVTLNLIHELAHHKGHAPDCSSRFESNLGELILMAINHKWH
jgi:hypothetical protein